MPAPSPSPPSPPADALVGLKKHLQSLQERGRTHIAISPEAKAQLSHLSSPPPASPTSKKAPVVAETAPPGNTPPRSGAREEQLAQLQKLAATGERTRALGTLRDTMVFAVGSPNAELMLVGEAPGSEEENQREPFVGPAGKLLTKILKAMGFERSNVYISNIVKYRPSIGDGQNQGPRNRPPSQEEIDACLPFIMKEIDIIRPKIIVALGGSAAKGLLGLDESVGRMRSRVHDLNGTPVIVTYHPSYLLRNEALSERRKVWEDMLRAMEHLGNPISEKQRGFFLPK